ncbi:hypothetical protein DL98DRAFT_514518 [Cadophora sp. DSE1049]|nr:hypothetical protein DL98DRAFT_514518 [Cadophora sp. DSE1049]
MMLFLKKTFAVTTVILALIAVTSGAPTPEGVLGNIGNSLSSADRIRPSDHVNPRIVPSDDGVIPSGRTNPSGDRTIPSEDRVGPSGRVNPTGRIIPSDRVTPRVVPTDDRVNPYGRIMPSDDRTIPSDERIIPSDDLIIPVGRDVPSSDRNIDPSTDRVIPSEDRTIPSEYRVIPSPDRTNPSDDRVIRSDRVTPSSSDESTSSRIHPRDKQLNDHLIHLETGVCFQDCIVNTNADNMCTFSFVEHSNWQSHAVLHIYDNHCNQIGENTAVTRDSLANPQGWGMSSELPLYLVLHVPRLWNQDSPAEFKWDYGNYRNMGAFVNNPFGDAFASTYRIPSIFKTGDREGSYTVGRAGFICK